MQPKAFPLPACLSRFYFACFSRLPLSFFLYPRQSLRQAGSFFAVIFAKCLLFCTRAVFSAQTAAFLSGRHLHYIQKCGKIVILMHRRGHFRLLRRFLPAGPPAFLQKGEYMAQIIVIGGGAAGMMAAGAAAREGHSVTVVEHNRKGTCRKVLITGKGRCNLTNDCDAATVMKNTRKNPKFLYSALAAFPPSATMQRFEELGVRLKTERGRRVFPVSDKAADIAEALSRWAKGCRILFGQAESICTEAGSVCGVQLATGQTLAADGIILATGGLSYPVTGSTGDGYRMAAALGHEIIAPRASLVPLVIEGSDCRKMAGLSLRNVKLTVTLKDKKLFSQQGEMLFTHFGVSGPLALSASAFVEDEQVDSYRLFIDLKPALDSQVLYARITRDLEKYANRQAQNCLEDLLPASMIPVMLERWKIDPEKRANQITREEKLRLAGLCKQFELRPLGKDIVEHAIITTGGISTRQVDPRTMQSKLIQNLAFAGEILDVDAYTGGYNLQIAFSTGQLAGAKICKR